MKRLRIVLCLTLGMSASFPATGFSARLLAPPGFSDSAPVKSPYLGRMLLALSHKYPVVRYAALQDLEQNIGRNKISDPDLIIALLNIVGHEGLSAHRVTAAGILRDIYYGDETAPVAMMIAALEDDNLAVRICAAQCLGAASDDPKVAAKLFEAAKMAFQRDELASLIKSLRPAVMHNPEILVFMLAELENGDSRVSAAAACSLGGAVNNHVVDSLLVALKDKEPALRAAAAISLSGAVNNQDVVTALLVALSDESSAVRAAAAESLGEAVNKINVAGPLRIALRGDGAAIVRAAAATSLGGAVNNQDVVDALLDALEDEDPRIHTAAAASILSHIQRTTDPLLKAALICALPSHNTRFPAAKNHNGSAHDSFAALAESL